MTADDLWRRYQRDSARWDQVEAELREIDRQAADLQSQMEANDRRFADALRRLKSYRLRMEKTIRLWDAKEKEEGR